MSIAQIVPAPKVETASWIVIALFCTAIIACALGAALEVNIAPSDFLVGP